MKSQCHSCFAPSPEIERKGKRELGDYCPDHLMSRGCWGPLFGGGSSLNAHPKFQDDSADKVTNQQSDGEEMTSREVGRVLINYSQVTGNLTCGSAEQVAALILILRLSLVE